ncbi:MAG: hypothetical protein R3F42_08015 [Pseudomonadota bacterium]
MDRFTRNYSLLLGAVVLALLCWVLYENPEVAALNAVLEADPALAAYPYRFRVLALEHGVAVMGTPRSAEFPAVRALGLLFPALAPLADDDPALQQAQLEMARLQERARARVLETGKAGQVRWQLDSDWLSRHGIVPGSY